METKWTLSPDCKLAKFAQFSLTIRLMLFKPIVAEPQQSLIHSVTPGHMRRNQIRGTMITTFSHCLTVDTERPDVTTHYDRVLTIPEPQTQGKKNTDVLLTLTKSVVTGPVGPSQCPKATRHNSAPHWCFWGPWWCGKPIPYIYLFDDKGFC